MARKAITHWIPKVQSSMRQSLQGCQSRPSAWAFVAAHGTDVGFLRAKLQLAHSHVFKHALA
jgi:hypothetical protein